MSKPNQAGFTLVEVMTVVAIAAIVSTIFGSVFRETLFSYLKLQRDSSTLSQLSFQSNRVTNVMRSTVSIEAASDVELVIYAYFYPSDAYVSRVRYYVATNGSMKNLVADLTPMTSNPPTGTPLEAKKTTVTILNNLSIPSSGKLFTYLNAGNSAISSPVADTSIIKSIRLSLGTATSTDTTIQNQDVQVVIRNRKNNL